MRIKIEMHRAVDIKTLPITIINKVKRRSSMDISKLQKHVADFSKAKGFEQASIETRTLFLITEVGEVVEEVLKLSSALNDKEFQEGKERLGLEMYDVVWNIFDLANKMGIDLEKAFKEKIEINKNRNWDDY